MSAGQPFQTWRGIAVETVMPPSIRAEFIPNELAFPRFRLEVSPAVLGLLQQLVAGALDACVADGCDAAEELLALSEALEALDA